MSLWSELTWDVVRRRLTNEFDLFMTNYLSKFPRNLALSEAVPHLPPLLNQNGGASTESLPFVRCLVTSSSIISGVCSNGDPLIAHASYFGLVSKQDLQRFAQNILSERWDESQGREAAIFPFLSFTARLVISNRNIHDIFEEGGLFDFLEILWKQSLYPEDTRGEACRQIRVWIIVILGAATCHSSHSQVLDRLPAGCWNLKSVMTQPLSRGGTDIIDEALTTHPIVFHLLISSLHWTW